MNAFDIFALIIFGYALIRGIFRGLVKELAAIVGVIAGFWGAYTYYPLVADRLASWIADPGYRKIFGFLVIFCTVLLMVSVVGVVLKYLMRVTSLGWLDRICGGLLGLLKAVLITSVVFMVLTAFLPRDAPLVRDSLTAPYITSISATLARITPQELKTEFGRKLREMRKARETGIR